MLEVFEKLLPKIFGCPEGWVIFEGLGVQMMPRRPAG